MITFPTAPLEPHDNEEIRALFANIDLVLANSNKILQNETYGNIRIKGTGIDGIYIGHNEMLLRDLITLWNNGSPWRNGQKFYYHLGGSPLSGMSFCTYWENGNIGCGRNEPSFCTLLKPANMVIKNLKESQTGINFPFPKRQASNMTINELIGLLK